MACVASGEQRAFRDLGHRMRELRIERGWTQEVAAERLGVGVRELQRIEAGRVNLTLRSLVRIARALAVPLRSLFDAPETRATRTVGRPPKLT